MQAGTTLAILVNYKVISHGFTVSSLEHCEKNVANSSTYHAKFQSPAGLWMNGFERPWNDEKEKERKIRAFLVKYF